MQTINSSIPEQANIRSPARCLSTQRWFARDLTHLQVPASHRRARGDAHLDTRRTQRRHARARLRVQRHRPPAPVRDRVGARRRVGRAGRVHVQVAAEELRGRGRRDGRRIGQGERRRSRPEGQSGRAARRGSAKAGLSRARLRALSMGGASPRETSCFVGPVFPRQAEASRRELPLGESSLSTTTDSRDDGLMSFGMDWSEHRKCLI